MPHFFPEHVRRPRNMFVESSRWWCIGWFWHNDWKIVCVLGLLFLFCPMMIVSGSNDVDSVVGQLWFLFIIYFIQNSTVHFTVNFWGNYLEKGSTYFVCLTISSIKENILGLKYFTNIRDI
jgi:hypothetical protein